MGEDWQGMLRFEAVTDQLKLAELQREQERKLCGVLRHLSETEDGQFFLRWVMEETGAFRQEFPADDRVALWNAGKRAFGMQVLERCAAAGIADTLLLRRISE